MFRRPQVGVARDVCTEWSITHGGTQRTTGNSHDGLSVLDGPCLFLLVFGLLVPVPAPCREVRSRLDPRIDVQQVSTAVGPRLGGCGSVFGAV